MKEPLRQSIKIFFSNQMEVIMGCKKENPGVKLGRGSKRVISWLLTIALIVTGITVFNTGQHADAAGNLITVNGVIGNETGDVYLSLTVEKTIPANTWGSGSPAVDLTQYAIKVVNNTGKVISDWSVSIDTGSDLGNKWNAGWNGVSASGHTISIVTFKGTGDEEEWDNKTIDIGECADGMGMQVAASAIEGASYTISYYEGESTHDAGVDETQTDPTQIGESSSSVKATITSSNISGDYHEYFLKVNNSLSVSIGDWIVRVPVSGITSAEQWGSWAKVKISYDSEYLYLTPSNSSDNIIQAGGSFGSTSEGEYKFNYKGSSNIDTSKAVVYYVKGSSSTGAFDSVVSAASSAGGSGSSGSSGSEGGQVADSTTNLNLDVEYNYAKLLQDVLYFYDANMCGTEVGEKSAFSWRDDCHTAEKSVTYTSGSFSKTVDVSGGFHDAGDHVKFGLPQGYSATVLGLAYYEFGEAFDELNQTSHYKLIMDYFCDYFKRCTVYDGDSVKAFCYQVGEGNSDHGYWGPPEKQTTDRPAYFADSSNPATDEVSVAISALALNYINFKNEEDLKVAKDLFEFVKNNSKTVATLGASGFYASSSWKDDYTAAAEALYIATGEAKYKTIADENYSSISIGWALSWDNTWPVSSILRKDYPSMYSFANYGSNVSAQGFKIVDGWGSARYNANNQFVGLSYDKEKDIFNMTDGSFSSWATGQMKYLLGNNKSKRNFIVGYNENSSKYPHHRAASNSSDSSVVSANHYTLLGALVGGPSDTNDTYNDLQTDYNCNEVALDYNAGIVGAAAGLYLLHKNDVDAINDLDTKTDLTSIGIRENKCYGIDSEPEEGESPSPSPSVSPSVEPEESDSPSPSPSVSPSVEPEESDSPSPSPSVSPSVEPEESDSPSPSPSVSPSVEPEESDSPSPSPSVSPSVEPEESDSPSPSPTVVEDEKEKKDEAAAASVLEKINTIGSVNYESGEKIAAAREAYDSLTADQKAIITEDEYKVLTNAESQYQALIEAIVSKEKADKAAANEVVEKIRTIGEVNLDLEEEINVARDAYNALTPDQKDLITAEEYKILTDAEAKLKELKNNQLPIVSPSTEPNESDEPSASPSATPSAEPDESDEPNVSPSVTPSAEPNESDETSASPSASPSEVPSATPAENQNGSSASNTVTPSQTPAANVTQAPEEGVRDNGEEESKSASSNRKIVRIKIRSNKKYTKNIILTTAKSGMRASAVRLSYPKSKLAVRITKVYNRRVRLSIRAKRKEKINLTLRSGKGVTVVSITAV